MAVDVQLRIDADVASLLENGRGSVDANAREIIVIELFRRGSLSRGRAAELLGMPLADFLATASRAGIPVLDVTEAELDAELELFRDVRA